MLGLKVPTVIVRKNDPLAPCTNCQTLTAKQMGCPECGKGFCGDCFIGNETANTEQIKCPHCKKNLFLPIR